MAIQPNRWPLPGTVTVDFRPKSGAFSTIQIIEFFKMQNYCWPYRSTKCPCRAVDTHLKTIYSFSPANEWYHDFEKFAGLYGVQAELEKIISLGRVNGVNLYLGWVKGDVPLR